MPDNTPEKKDGQIVYRPQNIEEEEKYVREMVADINKSYAEDLIKYLSHQHNDKFNAETHTIDIDTVITNFKYEAPFQVLLAFFNGMQVGKMVIDNRIATSVMALQADFSNILKGLTNGKTKHN